MPGTDSYRDQWNYNTFYYSHQLLGARAETLEQHVTNRPGRGFPEVGGTNGRGNVSNISLSLYLRLFLRISCQLDFGQISL